MYSLQFILHLLLKDDKLIISLFLLSFQNKVILFSYLKSELVALVIRIQITKKIFIALIQLLSSMILHYIFILHM